MIPKGKFDIERAGRQGPRLAGPGRPRPRQGRDLRAKLPLGRNALGLAARAITRRDGPGLRVVAIDYGAKRNILRCLASVGLRGDRPARHRHRRGRAGAEPRRRVPVERPRRSGGDRRLCRADDPGRAGARTCRCSASALATRCWRWRLGPRPQDEPRPPRREPPGEGPDTGKVEITSMNHGFTVDSQTLPEGRDRNPCQPVRRHRTAASRSTASRCSRSSTTPRPAPARRTATTCSNASPPRCRPAAPPDRLSPAR